MNIYITATPEILPILIDDVCSELNQVKGVMNFIRANQLTQVQLSKIDKSFENLEQINWVPFNKLFSICQVYRGVIKDVKDDDFLVLLTSIRNEKNWFSATENKNIFIDVNDWDQFTSKNPKYGISYQVVENIFQSLIGIYHNNAVGHPNVHEDKTGCINDMCIAKSEVIFKLRMGDICVSCQQKAEEFNVNWKIINHIKGILESICKNVKSLYTKKTIEFEVVKIQKGGKITIGSDDIKMKELPAALFIFFLNKEEPIAKKTLKKFKNEIHKLYDLVNGRGDSKTIDRLVDQYGDAFRKNKWCVNEALANVLNETLLGYYIIDEVAEKKYIINLDKDYREIDNNFKI